MRSRVREKPEGEGERIQEIKKKRKPKRGGSLIRRWDESWRDELSILQQVGSQFVRSKGCKMPFRALTPSLGNAIPDSYIHAVANATSILSAAPFAYKLSVNLGG